MEPTYTICVEPHFPCKLSIHVGNKRILELIGEYDGAVLPLIILDMESIGNVSGRLPKRRWERLVEHSDFQNWTWLLAYEGVRRNWLKDRTGKVLKHPVFAPLISRSIEFYDPARNVLAREAIVNRNIRQRARLRRSLASFLAGYP